MTQCDSAVMAEKKGESGVAKRIIGVDLSLTSTGLAIVSSAGGEAAYAIQPRGQRDIERLESIAKAILDEAQNMKAVLVVIEGYAYGMPGQANSLTQLAELCGLVKVTLHRAGIPFRVIPPSTVKKFASGKGNAKKDEMRLAVFKKWGFEAKTTDEVDAYVLARIGLALLGETPLLEYEKECLAKLKGGDAA